MAEPLMAMGLAPRSAPPARVGLITGGARWKAAAASLADMAAGMVICVWVLPAVSAEVAGRAAAGGAVGSASAADAASDAMAAGVEAPEAVEPGGSKIGASAERGAKARRDTAPQSTLWRRPWGDTPGGPAGEVAGRHQVARSAATRDPGDWLSRLRREGRWGGSGVTGGAVPSMERRCTSRLALCCWCRPARLPRRVRSLAEPLSEPLSESAGVALWEVSMERRSTIGEASSARAAAAAAVSATCRVSCSLWAYRCMGADQPYLKYPGRTSCRLVHPSGRNCPEAMTRLPSGALAWASSIAPWGSLAASTRTVFESNTQKANSPRSFGSSVVPRRSYRITRTSASDNGWVCASWSRVACCFKARRAGGVLPSVASSLPFPVSPLISFVKQYFLTR
mmetsp:Transcript_2404/g.7203  ORF Transcript_2404/g.7203 Transcript_2404/m.7203 type:complete len:396 (-) Transcript_2404:480-1667(-)